MTKLPDDNEIDFELPFGEAEMSLLVRQDGVPPSGKTVKHTADAETLIAMAARLQVEAVADLSFQALLTPLDKSCLVATGKLTAKLRQLCGVTLEPLWTEIEQSFTIEFQPAERVAQYMVPEDDFDTDLPEAMHNGEADIGEAVTQILAMEVPAYPRAPGVSFDGYGQSEDEMAAEDKRPSPFAGLADLKSKLESDGDET
ncbi:MAG: DUF177 domain-containing protein [Rhodobiaceae bacterium]|jgi:uncharacterized metal-binding protein YceD (DUF177 family)|nr:DUF177 domain-containing protein [Rhodobiaceae bacterium]MBT5518032.1 DUF177 domain-containing protein [Rhodobiaceae bacterium]MDG2494959.1 DUF177 domain-containing protein [Alphaproteobacteria bacterium]